MRRFALVLLLIFHGVNSWPDFREDKEKALELKGRDIADKELPKLVDEADNAGFLATEAEEALEIASDNLVAASKMGNAHAQDQARKNKQDAAQLAAEASQRAERKIAILAIASRKSLREARRNKSVVDRKTIKVAKEFANDAREKMLEAAKIASRDAVKIKWAMEDKPDDEVAEEPAAAVEEPAVIKAKEPAENTNSRQGYRERTRNRTRTGRLGGRGGRGY